MLFLQHRHAVQAGAEIELKRRRRRPKVTQEGTYQSVYVAWIKGELEREGACMELPFTLTLLMSFALLSLAYIGQDTIHLLEQAVNTDIRENANFAWAYNFGHKDIEDVNSYADFWSWCRLGFVPLVVPSAPYAYSEGLADAVPQIPGLLPYDAGALPTRRPIPGYRRPNPIRNDYLRYNRIIGGIRFRQSAAEASEEKCKYPGAPHVFSSFFSKKCTGHTDQELLPDFWSTESIGSPTNEEWLLSDIESHDEVIQHVIDMEDGCVSAAAQNRTCLCESCALDSHPWLNERTLRLELSFAMYNAEYGMHCMATVTFWFTRSGHIHKRINSRSSWAGFEVRDFSTMVIFIVAGMVWVFANFYVFRTEALEIWDQIRRSNKPWYYTLTEDYISFWNIVDWVSVAIAFAICGMFTVLTLQTYVVGGGLGEFAADAARGVTSTSWEYKEDVRKYYIQLGHLMDAERTFRFWLCLYPMVLMARMYKSFAAQPRLAVVTETFKYASSDLMHFFIVFGSVYFCMTINAVLFFGQDDITFSRLDWALFSVWRAMLGDWDWDGMRTIGREKAFVWFFMFMLIVVLIMANILISILMESYAAVKSAADNADSLFMQVFNMIRRARQTRAGTRVKLNDIQDALLQDADMIEGDMLKNTRPLLPIFRVTLDTSDGTSLGLHLEDANTVLFVRHILGGAAEKHNSTAKLLTVRPGDAIVEVNGVSGEAKELAAELAKPKAHQVRLRRSSSDAAIFAAIQRRGQSSMGRRPSKTQTRLDPVSRSEPGFLLDLVEGIPETQAKRTLKNSQEAYDQMYGEQFEVSVLKDDMQRIIDRLRNSIMCAGWMWSKFEEYDEDQQERDRAVGDRTVKRNGQEAIRDGIRDVRTVAQERTSELADDVAAVLGEEMLVLERRQKEQQRALAHSQESLQGLRQMVYKLHLTCEEVGSLCQQISRSSGRDKETIRVGRPGSAAGGEDPEDPSVMRAKLLASRAARVRRDEPLQNHRYSSAMGGTRT